jgi:hypothetical protein
VAARCHGDTPGNMGENPEQEPQTLNNKLRAGHVIVTLMFNGGPCQKLPNGPTVCGYITDTVLETWPGATVTGTARGGF